MKAYIYHFHAMKQVGSTISNQDGIIIWKKPIEDWTDYQEMKQQLVKNLPELGTDPEKVIVTNLSFLHIRRM